MKKVYSLYSRLQTTCETAANTFLGCFARKNYAAGKLPTHVLRVVLLSHAIIFHKKV